MKKRSRSSYESTNNEENNKYITYDKNSINDINPKFLKECEKDFYENPVNEISRNAIVAIGSTIITTDSKHLNKIHTQTCIRDEGCGSMD